MKIKNYLSTLLAIGIAVAPASSVFATSTDLTKLPLGDYKISTSPKAGYIYSCQTQSNGGGGAQTDGPWIHGSTWNLKEKISVQGSVSWPSAQFNAGTNSSGRNLTGNGLPAGSNTGTFPIAQNDPAYQYDRNPNSIKSQNINFNLPSSPTTAQTPSCLPMGQIGIALNGVAIFNGLDALNRDAVAHETQDTCDGHPEVSGMYHYHGPSGCMPHETENNALVGYALDGFGIYSGKDANGNEISTADLDECHGTTSTVTWDGKSVSMYHYVLTQDYPYTLGCFKGTPVSARSMSMGGSQPSNNQGNTSPSSPNITSSKLTIGNKGTDVVTLQNILEQQGYLVMPKGVAKGYFGAMTKNALKKYQKAHGLNSNGIFDSKTKATINGDAMVNPAANNNQPSGGLMPTPPQEAQNACTGKTQDTGCNFVSPMQDTITGTCKPIKNVIACVPAR